MIAMRGQRAVLSQADVSVPFPGAGERRRGGPARAGPGVRAVMTGAGWEGWRGRCPGSGGGLAGGGGWGEAEFGEPGLQQGQGAADGVGPAEAGLDVHDLLVEGLVVGVVGQGGLQGGEGLLGAGGLEDFGDAGQGVHRAAPRRFGVAFGPVLGGAVGQRPAVERGGALQGRQAELASSVAARAWSRAASNRHRSVVDEGGVEPVPAAGQGDEHRLGQPGGGAQHLAGLAQRQVALRCARSRGPASGHSASLMASPVTPSGCSGQVGEQLPGFTQPAPDLPAARGDPQRPEHRRCCTGRAAPGCRGVRSCSR